MLEISSNHANVVLQIVPPGETQIFTLPEASALIPNILQITYNAVNELEPIQQKLQRMLECDPRTATTSMDKRPIL